MYYVYGKCVFFKILVRKEPYLVQDWNLALWNMYGYMESFAGAGWAIYIIVNLALFLSLEKY